MSIVVEGGIRIGGNIAIGNFAIPDPAQTSIVSYTTPGTYTLTIPSNHRLLSAEMLLVGGGGAGGGGNETGGGGGAGGYIANANVIASLTPGSSYTVVVGDSGSFVKPGLYTYSTSGGNSSAFGFTAVGGGAGARTLETTNNQTGADGGSGGGASADNSATNNGGAGTAGQGNNGGQDYYSSFPSGGFTITIRNGGGGGGAGSAGTNATSSAGGTGGSGNLNSITGSSIVYAVGGGGSYWRASSNGPTYTTRLGTYANTAGSGGRGSYTSAEGTSDPNLLPTSGQPGIFVLKYRYIPT